MFVEQMNKKGVTLIELVVVFVVIAIMAGLLLPNIGAWLPNYRLRSATRDIVSTMRTAQMRAVSTNTRYRVDFSPANNNYVLQYQTTLGAWVNEGTTQNLPIGITFINADFGGASQAVFNPNSTSSGGSVELQNEKKKIQRSITLTPATGRVRIVD
jgi:prepilin-type N-terminal cleavage/methylation domain-containing protein